MKDVFLCHSGADKEWVEELGRRLEAERIGNRQITVFLDQWDIDYGENVVQRIETGLREAKFCAVILSPAMVGQSWPEAEWTARFMSDPGGRKHQLLPILLHNRDPHTSELIDIPMLLRPIKRFDFSQDSRFETEFAKLVRRLRGERPLRGSSTGSGWAAAQEVVSDGAEAPDDVRELLISNLLPVVVLPETIWSDDSSTQKNGEIWTALRGERVHPFWLGDGRLYSFIPPTNKDNPYKRFLRGTRPREELVSDWLSDADRSRIIIRLFNEALQEHAYHLTIRNLKDNRKQFYCPIFDGKPRKFQWGSGGRTRTVAKLGTRPDKSSLGIHCSAKMRFLTLGTRVFLLIEPGWMFTSDGLTPLQGKQVTVLSTKFGGKERNAALLRHVIMWSMLLANGEARVRLDLGHTSLVVDQMPAIAESFVGIDGDAIRLDRIFSGGVGGEISNAPAGEDELEEALTSVLGGGFDTDGDHDDGEAAS